MSTTHPITPDCQPVFPCWLWNPRTNKGRGDWWHADDAKQWRFSDTHFHPDQPTAPTERPDGLPPGLAEYNHRLETSQETPADIMAQHALPPEVQAACERLKEVVRVNYYIKDTELASDLRTLLAWVEGGRSDEPSPASQPLALALAAAAREVNEANCDWLKDRGTLTSDSITAILQRHVAPEFERVQRENERLHAAGLAENNIVLQLRADLVRTQAELDSAKQRAQDWQLSYASNNQQRAVVEEELRQRLTRTQAALEEQKLRTAEWQERYIKLVEVSKADSDDLRAQLTALRSAADDDRERLKEVVHQIYLAAVKVHYHAKFCAKEERWATLTGVVELDAALKVYEDMFGALAAAARAQQQGGKDL